MEALRSGTLSTLSQVPSKLQNPVCLRFVQLAGLVHIRLGSLNDAMDARGLEAHNIQAVLNAAWSGCLYAWAFQASVSDAHGFSEAALTDLQARPLTLGEWYLAMDAEDHPGYPIAHHFEEAVAFLRRCQAARRNVLVHCVAGLNRSACLCAAFLMREGHSAAGPSLSAADAVNWISQRRAGVFQNVGFLKQLLDEEGSDVTQVSCGLEATADESLQEPRRLEFHLGTIEERHEGMAPHAVAEELPRPQSRFKASRRHVG